MIRRTIFICLYLSLGTLPEFVYAEANPPSLQMIYGEDSSLDVNERKLASDTWEMVEQFLRNTPSFAHMPQLLTVIFARSDGPAVREVFGQPITGYSAEEFDGDGRHRIYLAWNSMLEKSDTPLLATFELITNKLYRLGFARAEALDHVPTEQIRGLTGTLLGLTELHDSGFFAELPESTRKVIEHHAVAYGERAFALYNSTQFKDETCARALITELFRYAR